MESFDFFFGLDLGHRIFPQPDNLSKTLENEQAMISKVVRICKLLHVSPATSATGGRSFSTARRVKTWLRANLFQKRFNNVAIMNAHKTRTDALRLIDVANEFVSCNDNRKRNFGTFTDADLVHI